MKVYGSRVFVKTPEHDRNTKWDDKAREGILLGYSEVGYRVLINGKIIDARHVEIVENNVRCIGFNDEETESSMNNNDDEESDVFSEPEQSSETKERVPDENQNEPNENQIESDENRETRLRKPNKKYYNDNFVTHYVGKLLQC